LKSKKIEERLHGASCEARLGAPTQRPALQSWSGGQSSSILHALAATQRPFLHLPSPHSQSDVQA
jgi:hypothetical protein